MRMRLIDQHVHEIHSEIETLNLNCVTCLSVPFTVVCNPWKYDTGNLQYSIILMGMYIRTLDTSIGTFFV